MAQALGRRAILKLDYVSPLPPVRSGIADYSADLLPHLAAGADVRLVRLPGQPLDRELARRWRPVEASVLEADAPGAGDRLPLYQMGNNPHHAAIRELALRVPGVVMLHDVVLHHLLVERTLALGSYEAYEEALAADHGWIGRAVTRPRWWGGYSDAALFALPAHRTLLSRQRGTLVHSRWAAATIAGDDPELAVRAVPMAVPLPPLPDADAARAMRRGWGVPDGVPLLGSFGFQTPIKRTLTAVRALAEPGLENAWLAIVGEVSADLDFAAAARRAGVEDRVVITGFVPFAELQTAIAATDLCINLRYPSAGETSASLLRVLALGRPAVVSDYGQFAELPEEVALRVPLDGVAGDGAGGEAGSLAAAAAELLAAPRRLAAMGRAARRHVAERHDPAAAAAAVIAAAGELAGLEPPAPAEPAAAAGPAVPPPTTLTWGELRGAVEVVGAGGATGGAPWPEGERRELRLRLTNRGPARWLAARRGPGGVAVEVKLVAAGRDLRAGRPWLELPRDLAAGERAEIAVVLRRPAGPARLEVLPRVMGAHGSSRSGAAARGFEELGGPVWRGEV